MREGSSSRLANSRPRPVRVDEIPKAAEIRSVEVDFMKGAETGAGGGGGREIPPKIKARKL